MAPIRRGIAANLGNGKLRGKSGFMVPEGFQELASREKGVTRQMAAGFVVAAKDPWYRVAISFTVEMAIKVWGPRRLWNRQKSSLGFLPQYKVAFLLAPPPLTWHSHVLYSGISHLLYCCFCRATTCTKRSRSRSLFFQRGLQT